MSSLRMLLIVIIAVAAAIFFVMFEWDKGGRTSDNIRADRALKITTCFPKSCQNPVFSPDGGSILFTRFEKGYNRGPAELVKIDLASREEKVIVNREGDNVNVPFGSWVGDKIVFSVEEGIAVASDDGADVRLILRNTGVVQYIEPVFNPADTSKIVLEVVADSMHRLELFDITSHKLTDLTDGSFDDRLPSWSPDGEKILWQRTRIGEDDWRIYVAEITFGRLENIRGITDGPDDTDNSWTWDGKRVLSSRTGDGAVPNIFVYSFESGKLVKITDSMSEDSAPSASPDGKFIAFESHVSDENSPTEIWVLQH